jgi:hypothetical protein
MMQQHSNKSTIEHNASKSACRVRCKFFDEYAFKQKAADEWVVERDENNLSCQAVLV